MCTQKLIMPLKAVAPSYYNYRTFKALKAFTDVDKDNVNYHAYGCLHLPVPCCTCVECLKKRQSSVAYRLTREEDKWNDIYFVTFTYDNDHLPLSARFVRYDVNTGELIGYDNYHHPDCVPGFVRSSINQAKAGKKPRYYVHELLPGVNVHYTPSLRRGDFSAMIKRFREQYERDHGDRIDFKYFCIGEYGPKTCRPHFHCLFYGLDRDLINDLVSQWPHGTQINIQRVRKFGVDGQKKSNHGLAYYVAKYLTKGKFECLSVKFGYAEKPRIICSGNVGLDVSDDMKSYLLCYDMVGEYDPDTLIKKNGDRLSSIEIVSIVKQIPKRRFYENNSYRFSLPRSLYRRVMYRRSGPQGSRRYIPVVLQAISTLVLSCKFDSLLSNSLYLMEDGKFPRKLPEELSHVAGLSAVHDRSAQRRFEEDMEVFYGRSFC